MPDVRPLNVPSSYLKGDRIAQIYLPPGYDQDQHYKVIYCVYDVLFRWDFGQWLDAQIAAGMAPIIAVGVPLPDDEDTEPDHRFIATELIPAVEAAYPVARERSGRRLLGFSAGGDKVVSLALAYGERFDRVAVQSPGWMRWHGEGNPIEDRLEQGLKAVAEHASADTPSMFMVWGDSTTEEWETRARANGERMVAALRELGVTVDTRVIPGGHDKATVRQGWPVLMPYLAN